MFRLFAELIAYHLSSDKKYAESQADLISERATAVLREQFIAVLGHDLRNPIASVDAGIRILSKTALDERTSSVVVLMRKSIARMSNLIDNLLDFARGRSSSGIELKPASGQHLASAIEQVVGEFRTTHPERELICEIEELGEFAFDRVRLEQLVSNLVGNALTHGDASAPVQVSVDIRDGHLDLSVSNSGEAIPAELMQNLFKPFFRARVGSQGLGLGLFIASEIAKAHGGGLVATSTAEETRFSFRMPIADPQP